MNTVGRKIRLLRHQKGWTQEDIAARLGLSVPGFSKIETGSTDITLSRLEQIAGLFDLSVIQLLILDGQIRKGPINETTTMNRLLNKRNSELIDLQKKMIELYEVLRTKAVS